MVAGRSHSIGSAPTGEAAFAARAAGVRVDGTCVFRFVVARGCLHLFVVVAVVGVCFCRCCGCGLLLLLCLWVVCIDIVGIAVFFNEAVTWN